MKKIYVLLMMVFAAFFACTLPSSIEIKGSPKLRFSANMDFSNMFNGMMSDAFGSGASGSGTSGNITQQDCVNVPDVQTFIIRMEILNDDFPLEIDHPTEPTIVIVDGVTIELKPPDNGKYTLDEKLELASTSSTGGEPISVPLSSLAEVLNGFEFKDSVKASFYISGSDFINIVNVELDFGDEKVEISGIDARASGIDTTSDFYTETKIPEGGHIIEGFAEKFLNAKNDLEVTFDIFCPEGETIDLAWFNEEKKATVTVVAELVIWLPLEFVAPEPEGADLNFPASFFDGAGQFVKSSTEFMKSLKLDIGMNTNPFKSATLIVQSGDIDIQNPLGAKSLLFNISEDDMEKIKAQGASFSPTFSIHFNKGGELVIPRNFKITTVSLVAYLDFVKDLGEM